MTTPHTTTSKQPTIALLALVAAVLLFGLLAINAWTHQQEQIGTDRLVTELCANTPDC